MISIRNLTKSISQGDVLFSGVNANMKQGELVVILGSSGSGKSTLLRCINLRDKWDKGKLFYKNQDIFSMGWKGKRLIRKEWSFIEGQPILNRQKSALKNVLSGSRKHRPIWRLITGTVSNDEYSDGMDYLDKVGLMDKAHRRVENLSGGEVQRVAWAKALAQKAKVIVADEPVSNLDPHTASSIMEDIRKMCKKEGLIFICTLPQVELAEQYATRILGLKNGSIAFNVKGRRLTQEEKSMIV